MATASRRRPPWPLVVAIAATLAVLTARRVRRRQAARDDDRPADLGFMRAIHAGLRRDAAPPGVPRPATRTAGPSASAAAEGLGHPPSDPSGSSRRRDDDLWPVLRRHLTDGQDLLQLDLMVAEHRDLEAAIEAVDAALSGNGGVRPAPWRGVRGDAGRGPLFEAADRGEQALLAMRSSPDPRARASTRCSNSTRSGMRRRWQPNGWSGVELAALGQQRGELRQMDSSNDDGMAGMGILVGHNA
jgi:hypothetical protein